MDGEPNKDYVQLNACDHPAANTAAVVTLTPGAAETFVLDWIHWSYDAAVVAAETLTISFGGTDAWIIDIPIWAAGTPFPPQIIPFPGGLHKAVAAAVVVTLSAAGAAVTGKLNVGYH